MRQQYEAIPKEAFIGVESPPPGLTYNCPSCGAENRPAISFGAMMRIPKWKIVNANTFMEPNFAWGYIQCDTCEAQQTPLWRKALTILLRPCLLLKRPHRAKTKHS